MLDTAGASWAGVVLAALSAAAAIAAFVVDKRRTKDEDLDKIDSERLATDDPSLGSMRRARWRLRKRKS